MIKKLIQFLLAIFTPVLVFAQNPININIPNPINSGDLMSLITTLLRSVVMPIAAVLVVLYIIYAGFTFVTAQGKPGEIEKAKQRLLWSLIGAGILLGAVAISEVVERTVNTIIRR